MRGRNFSRRYDNTKCTRQPLKTRSRQVHDSSDADLEGVNYNRSKHSESYDYVLRTNGWTQKRQFLQTCILTRYVQILNHLDLRVQYKRFEANTLASSQVNCVECLHARRRRIGRTIPIATMSRGVRKQGGQIPIAKICQGVLAQLFLNEMKCVAFWPIAFLRVYYAIKIIPKYLHGKTICLLMTIFRFCMYTIFISKFATV